MKNISAGGGVVFKTDKGGTVYVLMIFRRGVWDLPKGKQDKGESIRECAIREVAEEVGCEDPVIKSPLGTTYHEYVEGDEDIGKTTYWYAMTTETDQFHPEAEEGIEEVRWTPLLKARELVGYENLIEILNRFENWLKKNDQK